MKSKILAFVLLPLLASVVQGCGSPTTIQAGCGGGAGIPCATPTPTPIPTPTPPPPAATFNPFPVGAHWTMISNLTGGITTFDVLPQDHFGCESGDLVNLRITKQNAVDYWGAGATYYENFILLHEPNGGWRALGDFEQNYVDTTKTGTTNLLRAAGHPIYPYAISPGSGEENSTLDTMYFWKQTLGITFDCIPGDEGIVPAPPGTGNGVNRWMTQFSIDSNGNARAHYFEYAPVGLSEEIWVFPPAPAFGMVELDQISNAGHPKTLILTRQ